MGVNYINTWTIYPITISSHSTVFFFLNVSSCLFWYVTCAADSLGTPDIRCFLLLFCSPHEPLCGRAAWPVEGLCDEDVKSVSIDRRVKQKLQNKSGTRGEGHVQTVHQIRNDEVPKLQQLLGHRSSQEAHQECQIPEKRAGFEGFRKIPPCEHVCRYKEKAHQLVPLEEPLPHVEGEVAIICKKVTVDVGELPHQQQWDACEGKKEQWLFLQSLEEAKNAVVAHRDREGEEEGEGEEIKELGEVEAGLVVCPVPHHYSLVQHHKHQETQANRHIRPGHQQHCFYMTRWCEELQCEKHHLLTTAERQRHLGWRRLLIPFFHVL